MHKINYDDILFDNKLEIIIDNKTYKVEEPSLQQIIDYEQSVKELLSTGESGATGAETGQKWIQVIRSIFTCIPEEALKKKSMPIIRRIAADCTKFLKESMFVDAPEQEAESKVKKK